jgi:FlaA1/EpsC-like NDP-sugar epimerase
MIFTIGLMASMGFVAVRFRWRLLTGFIGPLLYLRRNAAKIAERVLIVGSGEGTDIANWILNRGARNRLITIVGVVDNEKPTLHGMQIKGNTLLGGIADLPNLIEQHDVGVVVLAIPDVSAEVTAHIAGTCIIHDVRLVMLTDLINGMQQQLNLPSRAN